ncbi:MAG: DUF927 domain-containing protein, partial [Mariprofundales bacterium]
IKADFTKAMNNAGLYPQEIIADGKVHRFSTNDKATDKAGWYSLHLDGVAAGVFQDFRTDDEPQTWCSKNSEDMTVKECSNYKQSMEKIRQQRAQERKDMYAKAAKEAQLLWKEAKPANAEHPYLQAKGVKPYGLRQNGDVLLIPIHINGCLTSIQRIYNDGHKLFSKGGEIQGGRYWIAPKTSIDDNKLDANACIFIAEGYATAATIHEAIGAGVAVAFNAGNLVAVSKVIRKKFPDSRIIIAADDDRIQTCKQCGKRTLISTNTCQHCQQQHGMKNIGIIKAKKAAEAVGARFIAPPFTEDDTGTDWNDYANQYGISFVTTALRHVLPTDKKHKNFGNIPDGYICGPTGVFRIPDGDGSPEPITKAAVWVEALSRDGKGGNWGRLMRWIDHDGKEHERAMPANMFHAQGNELAQELALAGLPIITGKERKLLQYLSAFQPDKRMTSAPCTGWQETAFVLPDQTLREPKSEKILFQPTEGNPMDAVFSSNGTLDEWRKDVAGEANTNLMCFAICASLAAPLRYLTQTDGGGFHFYGTTSKGKTTMLQAAASVWGNSSDPARSGGGDCYLQRWNSTSNALEGIAACFNDLPLIVDEIGEGDAKDFGRTIYRIISGTGKSRSTRTGGLRARKSWRVFLLSSGELPVTEYIAEGGGKVRGGQLVRLADIEASNIFANAIEANNMKSACAKYYGTAGRAFIERLNIESMRQQWLQFDATIIGDAPTNEAGRLRDRFALVAFAGELAINLGVLPWQSGVVLQTVQQLYNEWLGTDHAISEGERGMRNIAAFIERYGDSRFQY